MSLRHLYRDLQRLGIYPDITISDQQHDPVTKMEDAGKVRLIWDKYYGCTIYYKWVIIGFRKYDVENKYKFCCCSHCIMIETAILNHDKDHIK